MGCATASEMTTKSPSVSEQTNVVEIHDQIISIGFERNVSAKLTFFASAGILKSRIT